MARVDVLLVARIRDFEAVPSLPFQRFGNKFARPKFGERDACAATTPQSNSASLVPLCCVSDETWRQREPVDARKPELSRSG